MTGLGLNLRAHPLAIALANQQLDVMASHMSYRKKYADYMIRRLSVIPFLRMPSVRNLRTDTHAWYAFVMQFSKDQAPHDLTREEFVKALKSRGLTEVDIPRSTGLLNELPLFTHSHEAIPRYGAIPWHPKQPTSLFPVASSFFDAAVKLPMWATESDRTIVEHYANTFVVVAEEILGRSLGHDKKDVITTWDEERSTPLMLSAKL